MYSITLCVRTWREVRNFASQKFRLTLGIPQSWESFCSDFGYNHRSNRNLPMFLPKKWPHRLLLLPKLKSDSGSGSDLSQIFDSGSQSGSERKTQNPAGVDSRTPDPVPPLVSEIRGGRDEPGSGLDRTGSRLKPISAGSGLDRTAFFFQNWKIRTGSDWESFCCLIVIILNVSNILVWSDFTDLPNGSLLFCHQWQKLCWNYFAIRPVSTFVDI